MATIGPASSDQKMQAQMIQSGMDVARFNFSYGKHEEFKFWSKNIRTFSEKLNKNVAIMADLQGPRIRIRNLDQSFRLQSGPEIKIGIGADVDLEIDRPEIIPHLKISERLLMSDGMINLRILAKEKNSITCQVLTGGEIKSNSSINFPDSNLHLPVLSEKDKQDLRFALEIAVDFVALSFVQKASDLEYLRKYMEQISGRKILPKIIAKIETDEAIADLDEILKIADGIIVARGDLGIEIGREKIPMLQKDIIKKALVLSKPTIVATQMLASMAVDPLPTRAEVSDVANAVLDGADSVMLSNETTIGSYPLEAVKEMKKIIDSTWGENLNLDTESFVNEIDYLALSACELATKIEAKKFLAITKSGFTAKMLAKHRPRQRIIALTSSDALAKELAPFYGIEAFVLPSFNDAEEILNRSIDFIKKQKLVKRRDKVVLLAGHPAQIPSQTNLLKVITI
ncbi:MAG: pyruvate kinase [Patescibacteria group bacterium]|nr:pyruvate kinase [Patescibacteria group bacterium]